MTDKTIINGVDVSKCLHIGTNGLSDHKIPYCREFTGNCKAFSDCYYKQSVRKDERIEELEQKLSQITELADLIVNDNDKPACVHDKECPLNGGDGFDNHCNTTCPFIIVQQINQIAQGE